MSDTTANPAHLGMDLVSLDLPAWKKVIGGVCAVLLAILFFVSGAWKLTDPFMWSQALAEFRVPGRSRCPARWRWASAKRWARFSSWCRGFAAGEPG